LEKESFDLKSELKAIGMTQKDFAKTTGFSPSTISVWNTKKNISKVGENFLNVLKELQNKNRLLEQLKDDCLKIKVIESK